jgi:hypothetical protein
MLRWHFNTVYLFNNSQIILSPTSKIIVQDEQLILTMPNKILSLGHKSLLGEDVLSISDIALSDRISKLLLTFNIGA